MERIWVVGEVFKNSGFQNLIPRTHELGHRCNEQRAATDEIGHHQSSSPPQPVSHQPYEHRACYGSYEEHCNDHTPYGLQSGTAQALWVDCVVAVEGGVEEAQQDLLRGVGECELVAEVEASAETHDYRDKEETQRGQSARLRLNYFCVRHNAMKRRGVGLIREGGYHTTADSHEHQRYCCWVGCSGLVMCTVCSILIDKREREIQWCVQIMICIILRVSRMAGLLELAGGWSMGF